MHIEWYGQSAFRLTGDGHSVVIDPFGDMSALAGARGMRFDYPDQSGTGGSRADHPRARRPQRPVDDRRLAADPALDGREA